MRGTAGITRSRAVASAKHAMRRPAAGTCQAATGLTASELQAQYGNILAEPPLADATSPYLLHRALTSRHPPIAVSDATVKVWWNKYRHPGGAEPLKSAQEVVVSLLEEGIHYCMDPLPPSPQDTIQYISLIYLCRYKYVDEFLRSGCFFIFPICYEFAFLNS